MCYSVINRCGYCPSGTLSALASNGNTLYNVMGVKRHIIPINIDLPESESISGIEMNFTVKGKRLRGNTGIVHLSIVRWNLLKRNI